MMYTASVHPIGTWYEVECIHPEGIALFVVYRTHDEALATRLANALQAAERYQVYAVLHTCAGRNNALALHRIQKILAPTHTSPIDLYGGGFKENLVCQFV